MVLVLALLDDSDEDSSPTQDRRKTPNMPCQSFVTIARLAQRKSTSFTRKSVEVLESLAGSEDPKGSVGDYDFCPDLRPLKRGRRGENRGQRLFCRLLPSEVAEIEKAANAARKSKSEWIRESLLSAARRTPKSGEKEHNQPP